MARRLTRTHTHTHTNCVAAICNECNKTKHAPSPRPHSNTTTRTQGRSHIVACAIIYPLMCNYKQFFLFVIYNGATKIRVKKKQLLNVVCFIVVVAAAVGVRFKIACKLSCNNDWVSWDTNHVQRRRAMCVGRRMRAAATFATCPTDKNSSQIPAISFAAAAAVAARC